MKNKFLVPIVAALCCLFTAVNPAFAQGTAFTYQGRLNDNGSSASGVYDLRFTIYDATGGGSAIAGPLTNSATAVSNGLFTVVIDFGANFPGADRWLEIGVRTNGTGAFTTLSPRQPLTATPYAITAGNVTGSLPASQLTGTIPLAQLPSVVVTNGGNITGTFSGDGSGLTGLAAANLTGTVADARLSANVARLNVPNTATQATGTPVVTSGFITGANVTSGGSGYVTPPTVTVNSATGSGAVIGAQLSGGAVISLTVSNAGSGYPTNTTLTIAPPPSNAYQVFSSLNIFSGVNQFTNPANQFTGTFAGNGAGLTNLNGANLLPGSITAGQLAAGAAATNLAASGLSGVAGGGMILSSNFTDANLINAGYVKLAKVVLGDFWEQRATNGAPSARSSHTAVWTGSEMIVWGGYGGGSLNTGGRYNPAGNSWTAVTTNSAPSARSFHTAVWTGSEMIVWGGNNGTNYFNDGGRYNTNGNSWTAVTTNSAPSARGSHTAVWTGSEMIVWGGAGGSNLNIGGRYNPAGNSWTAVTTNGAPAVRGFHTAVWTGSEMIVWGGFNNSSFFNDGGRFSPVASSWATMTTSGAPAGRDFHTAVWTGSEMLVFGGHADFGFNDTFSYKPTLPLYLYQRP